MKNTLSQFPVLQMRKVAIRGVLRSAILYRDDNVGPDVIIPDNVDQFGMVLED